MIGTSFLRVAAHDDDSGSNAAITYSMSKEQPEYLQVNLVTGWVYVKQPISQVGTSPEPQRRTRQHPSLRKKKKGTRGVGQERDT